MNCLGNGTVKCLPATGAGKSTQSQKPVHTGTIVGEVQ